MTRFENRQLRKSLVGSDSPDSASVLFQRTLHLDQSLSTLRHRLGHRRAASGSALNLLDLRDITLARAENEVGREIVLRLPVAERNVSDFKTEALY